MKELSTMVRLKNLLAGLLCVIGGAALAADAAYPEPIGFSRDGSRFSFVEWGQQDGSGYSYANLYFIDLTNDSWINAPERVLIEDESVAPRAALAAALEAGSTKLAAANIDHPARLVFARPFVGSDGSKEMNGSGEVRWSLPLETVTHQSWLVTFPMQSANCQGDVLGFALNWDGAEVYRDEKISKSRGCPTDYTLERVYIPDFSTPSYAVALIGVFTYGFEGRDMRHIAVPIPLQ